MDKSTHFAKLQNMYDTAPCNKYYEPILTLEEGHAQIQIDIKSDYFHAAGAVHGSVYFKALDDAAFFSANSLVRDVFVLTKSFNIHFIRPINSGFMIARGLVVQQDEKQIWAEALLFNDKGKEIGKGTGTFIKSKIELTPEMGYEI